MFFVFLTLSSCTMNPQNKINHNDFQELHKHQGSENYEVIEIFDEKFEIRGDILVDKQNQNIIEYGYKEQKLERSIYQTKRITSLGKEIDVIDNSYKTLKDGTIILGGEYLTWAINGDTTRQKFVDPFTNEEIEDTYEFTAKEKDHGKWLEKFEELYTKAQYIYIYI